VKKKKNVKLSLSMQRGHIRGTEVRFHSFLTLTLDVGECSGCFISSKEPFYPLNWRPGGPQGHFGQFWSRENFFHQLASPYFVNEIKKSNR